MPPRRFTTLIVVVALCLTSLFIFSSSTRQAAADAVEAVTPPESIRTTLPKFDVPDLRWSFQKSAHKPPEQKNSSSGDSSWYADWRWLNPFSSSVTLDEDRAVLPPLPERLPVYTFYDTSVKRDKDTETIDAALLLTWRKAWWAHGFRPVILSQAEAMNHPLYPTLQTAGMPSALEFEFTRWLAWGHMGTGLLSSWHCVPMSAYDDILLSHLRRGQFELLTRFEGLGAGLFAGEKSQINDALKEALYDPKLSTYKSVADAINSERFRIEQPSSFAHYDSPTITARYPKLAQKIVNDPGEGRQALNKLIIAHLHTTWQNIFRNGIAVLKPLPKHSTSLIKPSLDLAKLLAQCPESILQSSCPPNRPKCSPCVGSKMRITTPASFRNMSTIYTISTVPHPYTMITLNNQTSDITAKHIRRDTDRDQWLFAVTRDILGDGRGGPSRVVGLKDAVASEYGSSRSIWFATEEFPTSFNPPPPPAKSPSNDAHPEPETFAPFPDEWVEDLDWHFGFSIPRTLVSHGESLPPVPGPERWAKAPAGLPAERKKSDEPEPPTDKQVEVEVDLLRKARDMIKSNKKEHANIMAVAEAWNLADTEAWKFVRAYRSRAVLDKSIFLEEEAKYVGIESARGNSRWWGS